MPIDCLSNIDERIIAHFVKAVKLDWAAKAALMKIQSERDARFLTEHRKSLDGIGSPILEVPQEDFHRWLRQEGEGCWRDKGFLRHYAKMNPQCAVKAAGTKIQFGFKGT
jgi:hypothetical protein